MAINNPKGNLDALLKQAQEMQAKMQQAQKELSNMVVRGEAGGGLVYVEMNGRHDVLKVFIEPNLVKEDKEVLEDLLAAAFNDAVRKVEKASREKLTALTAGMQLPPGFETPPGGEE